MRSTQFVFVALALTFGTLTGVGCASVEDVQKTYSELNAIFDGFAQKVASTKDAADQLAQLKSYADESEPKIKTALDRLNKRGTEDVQAAAKQESSTFGENLRKLRDEMQTNVTAENVDAVTAEWMRLIRAYDTALDSMRK